jgi:hypothetical protein
MPIVPEIPPVEGLIAKLNGAPNIVEPVKLVVVAEPMP